jgi:2-phospho-L-lactate/phosphoenolpyruvate guanylyltransferase
MISAGDIWAVVPVKETASAKQRLAGFLSGSFRQQLALAMFEDVMEAVTAVAELRGVIVVTLDPTATGIALQFGAQVWTEGAGDGHTGAVTAAAHRLAATGATMLTMPGDIPLVSPADVQQLLRSHASGRAFTIVPARDKQGSNAILCTPADAVPLRFGPNSFYPHLSAAEKRGLVAKTVLLPRVALDIDEPADIAEFLRAPSSTSTWRLLAQLGGISSSLAMAEGEPQ